MLRLKGSFQQSRFSERVIIAAPRLRKFRIITGLDIWLQRIA